MSTRGNQEQHADAHPGEGFRVTAYLPLDQRDAWRRFKAACILQGLPVGVTLGRLMAEWADQLAPGGRL